MAYIVGPPHVYRIMHLHHAGAVSTCGSHDYNDAASRVNNRMACESCMYLIVNHAFTTLASRRLEVCTERIINYTTVV